MERNSEEMTAASFRSPMDLFALVESFLYPKKLLLPHGKVYGPIQIRRFDSGKWAVMWGAKVLDQAGNWHFFEAAEFRAEEVYVGTYHEAFARADRFAEVDNA